MPLLFCLLPSLSLVLPMSTPQAAVVAVGCSGADTSSSHPCPQFVVVFCPCTPIYPASKLLAAAAGNAG
ncbi:hypothetical protein L208DRAFT_1404551 [Tricholoma matsutake]|nr:hypothetical protein L208DRAFT_1404551 [Tricholoma matsutake 945]